MAEFVMPSLGADMERGTIIKWLVKPGDTVHRGQIVVEIETEKADMEVEIFQDGIVDEILVSEGEVAVVGAPLARIRSEERAEIAPERVPVRAAVQPATPKAAEATAAPAPSESHPPAVRATSTARVLAEQLGIELAAVHGTGVGGTITRTDVARSAKKAAPPPVPAPAPARAGGRGAHISPRARRLADELGVELAAVEGRGPNGTVTGEDVERTAAAMGARARAPASSPTPTVRAEGEGISGRQRIIGSLMERAKREIPHYYLGTTIDLSKTMAWLERENLRRPVTERLMYSAVLLKAVASAVPSVPEMNGHYVDGGFTRSDAVHLGVAISLRDGSLVAPAIQDAQALTVDEIMQTLRDLVTRARAGKLRASEMANATITVTNLGDRGVEVVHGIIYPPQVALIGFGKVVERPWAEGGMIGVRPTITATLAADHRVSNGHRGGIFLSTLDQILQEPESL